MISSNKKVVEVAQTTKTKEDLLYAMLFGISGVHGAGSAIPLGISYMRLCAKSELHLNPYFVESGNIGESPKTVKMLGNRKLKLFSSAGAGLVGAAYGPVVSTFSAPISPVKHLSAAFSTAIHLNKLSAQLSACKPFGVGDEQIRSAIGWLRLAIGIKQKKLVFRGAEAALATTSTLLSLTGIGLVGKVPIIFANFSIEMVRLSKAQQYETICKIAAMEMHWAAFLELNNTVGDMPDANWDASSLAITIEQLEKRKSMLGAAITTQVRRNALDVKTGGTGLGPATLLIKEIMAKHTLQGQFSGSYDYLAMINEPAGWNAIAAKMMNM